MVLEVAQFTVKAGQEDQFAEAYTKARHLIAEAPGCRSVRMTRGVESPSRFVLLVEWESVEAHVRDFRGSERFQTWRAAIDQYIEGPPTVGHFTDVA